MPSGRGQSEMVGVLSVLVLVVAVVVTLGSGFLAGIDTSSKPLLDGEVAADATDVTVTHRGGDSIDASELTVVLRDGRGNVTRFSMAAASITGDADGRFDPGETASHGHGFSGDVVEVLIVHGPTNAALVDETVDVETAGGGAGVANAVPTATFDVSPDVPSTGETVTFDASASTDTDGTITAYEWDFDGDGRYDETGETATHGYGTHGTFTVRLRVTDDHGAVDTVTTSVSVNARPTANVTYAPDDPSPGESITFDASNSTDADGTIASYEWDFDDDGTVDETGATASHTYLTPGTHTVTLRVADDDGATDAVNETVTVEVSAPNQDPVARFSYDRNGWRPNDVDLDAAPSFDPDGSVVSYEWDIDGDGVYEESGPTVEGADIGWLQRVRLRVTDDDGATDTFEWWIFW